MYQRIRLHTLFWIVVISILSITYGIVSENFWVGLQLVLMLLPVHLLYFYLVAYWIPKCFYKGQYVKLAIIGIACTIASTLLFRIIEISLAEPFIYRYEKSLNNHFSWPRMNGSFKERLFKPLYLINAFEQSNLVVWTGLSLKFIKMWYEKKQVALQAELNFLKGQIHPHFLFNTLNNLYALSLSKSSQAPAVILGLSDILRYMLYECNSDKVSLEKDIAIVQNYIRLEKIRYEDRLDLNFITTGNTGYLNIAPLLMLPLVENAFKHGVSETVESPWINIELHVKEATLLLKVSNSKPRSMLLDSKKHFENIGLSNVRKRLKLLYPNMHHLEFIKEEEVFISILQLNLKKEGSYG